jgi:hypothetical protein
MIALFATGTECMPALVDALVTVAQNVFTDLGLHAIGFLAKCAQWLSETSEKRAAHARKEQLLTLNMSPTADALPSVAEFPEASADAAGPFRISEQSPDLNVWVCILRGLAHLISDKRLEVHFFSFVSSFVLQQ